MGPIRFSGMNSGLPPDIVERIMEAERIPVQQMERQKSNSEAKLKLVDELQGKLQEIRNNIQELVGTRGFSDMKITTGDPNVLSGTVDPNTAVTGSWDLEVVQLAQKPAAITNGFPDRDKTHVGVGYIKVDTPEGKKEVYISGENSTLDGVAAEINGAGVGLRASVINDRSDKDNPYRLIITGMGRGGNEEISFPTLYLLDGDRDLYFEERKPASNGIIKLDGFEVEIGDNTIKDLIPGATIDLKQAAPGKEITISVKEDFEAIGGKVDEFVKAVNGVLSFIQSQNQMNEATDTTRTLGGDSMLRQIEGQLRRLFQDVQTGAPGTINRLSQLGIEFNRSGTLDFKKETFDAALSQDPAGVQTFLSGDGLTTGFAPRLRREIGNILDSAFGPIANRQRGLRQKIDQVNNRIDRKEQQLERREVSLVRQFSQLEQAMSRLQSQGGAVAGIGAGVGVGT